MTHQRGRSRTRAVGIVLTLASIALSAWVIGCQQNKRRIVEQFNTGPAGGPWGHASGNIECYLWVRKNDNPPPGSGWADVDPNSLTDEQKARIRRY